MAIANKAFVWSLFAAGGTLTAFLFPVIIFLYVMISAGYVPSGLDFDVARSFVASWPGKIILFAIIFLSVWHAAHRARVVFHDFGIRADGLIAIVLYSAAAVFSILSAIVLLKIS